MENKVLKQTCEVCKKELTNTEIAVSEFDTGETEWFLCEEDLEGYHKMMVNRARWDRMRDYILLGNV